MSKRETDREPEKLDGDSSPAKKPLSLHPVPFEEAVADLLKVKPKPKPKPQEDVRAETGP